MAARRSPPVFQSFNYAFEGVIHALRTQRNMRIHFAVAAGVLVVAFIYDVTRLELIARPSARFVNRRGDGPINVPLIELALSLIVVRALKTAPGLGMPLRGGL